MPSIITRLKLRKTRSPFRSLGDQARGKQLWAEAATHYRNHLLLVPQDVAIWIQLGHSLRENGDLQDASLAYRRAWELNPADSDVLLHYGHSLLGNGDVANAKLYLNQSAEAGNLQAAFDLRRLGEKMSSNPKMALSPQPLLDAISRDIDAFQAIDSIDIKILSNGYWEMQSNDPWVLLEWRKGMRPVTPMALLTIEMAAIDREISPSGQIYADLGKGFTERYSASFSLEDGKISILLVEPQKIQNLRFDPDMARNVLSKPKISVKPIAAFDDVRELIEAYAAEGKDCDKLLEMLRLIYDGKNERPSPLSPVIALNSLLSRSMDFSHDYAYWLSLNASPSKEDYTEMARIEGAFAIRPTFSFVMPTYNTPPHLLAECLDSLLAQTYRDFEICIADDNSPNPEVLETIREYAQKDDRIKFVARKHNGHISASSNSALSLATGEFIVLVDHDDTIPDYALFVVAYYINKHPDAEILFSDEDKITIDNDRVQPYFKSDFNKFLMYGHNMVSHLGVYRRSIVQKVGGFRLGLEGSQDYDLLLRCLEQTNAQHVVHIPHVLYHWRIIPGSTAMSADQKSYAVMAAQNAINGHFERQNIPLRSINGFAPGCTAVQPSRTFNTSVSIIIPTRNGLDILKPCIESIFACDHEKADIIIMDNGSDDPETLSYLEILNEHNAITVMRDGGNFNFSRINNSAAAAAKGEILCFLNNDTEVLSRDWLNRARTFLSIEEIGMVGARLLFPDGMLQHFGIALGMGEHGIAGIPHFGMDASLPGYFGKARLLQEVSAVTAACMFVRKKDFDAVGGFEEALEVAYNDVDLCLKIRSLGLKILVDPDITLIHKESRSRGSDKHGTQALRLEEEAKWMRERWSRELESDPYYSPNIDLGRIDFAYAVKSRKLWPWELTNQF